MARAKVITITLKEAAEMRRMGYTVKAEYKTARGVPFVQCFTDYDFELFEAMRKDYGTELVGYARL